MIKNKKGIIFGIANDHSIAWGIAKKLSENGAELILTYQNESLLKSNILVYTKKNLCSSTILQGS